MRDEHLEVAKVGEATDTRVGGEDGLQGTGNAQEVGKLKDGIRAGEQHDGAQEDKDASQVQGQHGVVQFRCH